MNRPIARVLVPALAAGLLATLPGPDALRYAPAAETTLERVFVQNRVLMMEELQVVMDGQEIPSEYLPEMELDIESASHVEVTDHIVEAAGGRPLALERTFLELAATASSAFFMAPSTETLAEGSAASPLEGEVVVFTWDAEGGAFEATRAGENRGSDLLDGLHEDMDLRGFLPAEDVELDGTWEVDASVLAAVLSPGGELGWEWTNDELAGNDGEAEELEGKVSLRLVSVDAGAGTARVELGGTLTSLREVPTDLEAVPVADGTATQLTTTTYVLDGALVWNTDAGHLARFELEAATDVTIETKKDPGQTGPDYVSTMTMSGTWSCEVTVEAG